MIESVYVHYPFCLRKCDYCSFFSIDYSIESQREYIQYLLDEIRLYSDLLEIKPRTMYFGGGTPSLMETEDIGRIMSLFDLSEILECTVEVNPVTVSGSKLLSFKELKIDRLSLGFQSFIDDELRFLSRKHTGRDNIELFDLVRKCGYENVSIDLIYGLPGQTLKHLVTSLDISFKLEPEHISTYCLSLEEGTHLFKNRVSLPDDEITSGFYRYIREKMSEAGYEQYEISNFYKGRFNEEYHHHNAKEPVQREKMSLHNLSYWENRQYIGFGSSSHSFVMPYRFHNPSNLEQYYSNVKEHLLYPGKELQDKAKRKKDVVIQSLRLTRGLDLRKYNDEFGEDFLQKFSDSIKKHKEHLEIEDGFMRLLPESCFVSNEIIMDFID